MAFKFNLANVANIVAAVGAVNWGADAFGYNLVEILLPTNFVVYAYYLVGAAGIYALYNIFTKK